jgi:hypothetical protein
MPRPGSIDCVPPACAGPALVADLRAGRLPIGFRLLAA